MDFYLSQHETIAKHVFHHSFFLLLVIQMPDLMHDSGIELNLEDFQFGNRFEQPLLAVGQAVEIADGILEGATGIIAKRFPGHYLVSLGEPKTGILARFPAHLVQAE